MNKEKTRYLFLLIAAACASVVLPLILQMMLSERFLFSTAGTDAVLLAFSAVEKALAGVALGALLLAAADYPFRFCLPFAAFFFFYSLMAAAFQIAFSRTNLLPYRAALAAGDILLSAGVPLLGVALLKIFQKAMRSRGWAAALLAVLLPAVWEGLERFSSRLAEPLFPAAYSFPFLNETLAEFLFLLADEMVFALAMVLIFRRRRSRL